MSLDLSVYWTQVENWFRVRMFYVAYNKLFPNELDLTMKFIKAITVTSDLNPIPERHKRALVLLYLTQRRWKNHVELCEAHGLYERARNDPLIQQIGTKLGFDEDEILATTNPS